MGLGLVAMGCSAKPEQDCTSAAPKVLFICQAGTVKSAVARELFKRRAAERGVSVAVKSRGIKPEDHMSSELLAATQADGIDPKAEPAQALTVDDLRDADVVIFFDRPPSIAAASKALDWTDVPSMNADYAGTRAMILARGEGVLDQLAKKPCAGAV